MISVVAQIIGQIRGLSLSCIRSSVQTNDREQAFGETVQGKKDRAEAVSHGNIRDVGTTSNPA